MRILLINHYAGSPNHGMEYRVYYMAREWVRLGHDVRIIASAYSHLRFQQPLMGNQKAFDEIIDDIHYTWLKAPSYNGNGISRTWNIATFIGRLYQKGGRFTKIFNPDIVIASSTYPMDIWPARRIARISRAKLVYEVHDLWPLSPIELGGMSKWHPFIMLVQAAEDYAYRHSDVVVSMLPKVREYMESRGMAPHKLHIVPNGIDPSEWEHNGLVLDKGLEQLFESFKSRHVKIVGYAGAHGIANALNTLIDAAKIMREENVIFVLVGSGPEKATLQKRVATEGLQNVYFLNPIYKGSIPKLLEKFDIAYIGLQNQNLFRFGIAPNKLMDYMMAARPVLMAINAGNDLVGEAGCGVTVKPENPQSIVQGIQYLLGRPEDERKTMGQRGRTFVLQHHVYSVLAQNFLNACN
jgi:glycosyltransferase involved in cell wall biosynthesis